LRVLEREVDKCRRLFYDLQVSWEKRGTTPKEWKMKESHHGYHSKVCTQVVSTMCLFDILVNHYFYTVLLEKGVSNKVILKA